MGLTNYIQAIIPRHGVPSKVLGLPVDDVWATWTAVLVIFFYYMLSSYPDLSVWDSPLIALAAIQGGVGHPPGYPLHTLMGTFFSQLPGVSPLTGIKLLSIIPGALICVPIMSLSAQMKEQCSTTKNSRRGWGAAVFVIILFIHPVLWDPATRVEVYTLAAFFAAWAVARLGTALQTYRAPHTSLLQPNAKGFFVAGLSLGASASVHPVVAATTAATAFASIIKIIIRVPSSRIDILKFIAGGLLGLMPYLRILFIANYTDRLVWGKPTNFSAYWDFLSARDYATNVGPDIPTIISQLFDWLGWSVMTGTILFAIMGLVGWTLIGKHGSLGRSGPVSLCLAILAICTNTVWVPENPDYLGYLCGPFAICASGGAALLSYTFVRPSLKFRFGTGIIFIPILLVGLFASPAVHLRSRHCDHSARLQAQGALEESPQDGILVVGSDHLLWPVLYLQEIERKRTDVVIIAVGLASSSWYWQHLYRNHPMLNPFDIHGEDKRTGRVRRFLAAHPDRPIGIESIGLAYKVGVTIRGVGWMLLDRPIEASVTDKVSISIEHTANNIGTGSRDGMGTLSLVSYLRGIALWILDKPEAAYNALLAGVPPSMKTHIQRPKNHWKKVSPPKYPIPSGVSRIRGLGEPNRNLSLAQYLVKQENVE